MSKINLVTDDVGILAVKLTDANETMSQILARIKAINTAQEHVYFDTSAIPVTNPLYLCTIYMDYGAYTDPTIVRLTDQVTGKQYIGNYSASETIGQVLAKAVDAYVAIIVTATTQDGVTVTGQTVSLYEGSSAATGVLRETAAYNGQPVSFMVSKGFEYFITITSTMPGHFSPSTAHGNANALTSVTLTYQDTSHITDFAGIQSALAAIGDEATARQALKGKEIDDKWIGDDGTTEYTNPMVVMDVKMYEDVDGVQHLGAKMRRKYCTLHPDNQFDAPNTEVATEETAQAGIYYYGLEIGQTSPTASKITLLTLNEGDAIPYSTYAKVYRNAVRDTSKNIIQYGYNRYRDSAVRQYLNSSAGVGAWWTQPHAGQVAPSQHASKRGYMAGCSAALLAAVKPVKIQCYTNTVTDGGVVDVISTDKFFLDSGTEVYGVANENEGTYDALWRERCAFSPDTPGNAATAGRINYRESNHAQAAAVWVRSASRGNSYVVFFVSTSGNLYSYDARFANALAPACVIY